jgi:4-amino-4-deoxy-L-arabinose transferase-like glycosyltransferase
VDRAKIPSQAVSRVASLLESLPARRGFFFAILALVLLLFSISNLPWNLDEYDEAKQAFVSFEITKNGEFWFQHTPQGRYASKPPLMGWISSGLHAAGIPWNFAWRLPPFLCAIALLILLAREGGIIMGQAGATLAVAAFGLNLMTPRIASFVRTDMMLGAFIFAIGWLIYRKIRAGTAWTMGERWMVFAFMVAALFTKGPVIYAFLLPGLIAFVLVAREKRGLAWSGWWTWALPFALFLVWLGLGLREKAFYDDVVVREFFSRFEEGGHGEKQQLIFFYFAQLLHKFAPWSLLLVAFAIAFPKVRRGMSPHVLWLVLWAMGGLLLMTFVPSKRLDRIFPVLPPLCLLLVEWCALLWHDRRARVSTGVAILAAMFFAGGYFMGLVPVNYRERTPALVEFSERVRALAREHDVEQITLPRSRDEGLLMYFDLSKFSDKSNAFNDWKKGKPMALVISDRTTEKEFFEEVGKAIPALDSGELKNKNEKRYFLFLQK